MAMRALFLLSVGFSRCSAADEAIVGSFGVYPGYAGDLTSVSGVMSVKSMDGTQSLSWALSEVDPRCSETCTATNCCGVHIHVGMTCGDSSVIGGHYWNDTAYGVDPWLTVMYNASESMATTSELAVATGLSASDVLGRAMVIHDFTGARIACGIISVANVPSFGAYPGYTGNLATSGVMTVTSNGGAQNLAWIFTAGLDPLCAETCTATNCCGVHIHAGMDCNDATTIGGHYYDNSVVTTDPWLVIMYNASTMPSVMKDVVVTTGYDTAQVTGHTMVIHDSTGARIACGTISLDMNPMDGVTTTIQVDVSAASFASFAATFMLAFLF